MPRVRAAVGAAVPLKLLEMSHDRLSRTRRDGGVELTVDPTRNQVRGCVASPKGLDDLCFSLTPTFKVLVQQRIRSFNGGTVRGQDSTGPQRQDTFERPEIRRQVSVRSRWHVHGRPL